MAALGWLLNLFFKGGGFQRGPDSVVVVAVHGGGRRPEAVWREGGMQSEFTPPPAVAPDEWTHIILDTDFVHGPTTSITPVGTGLLFTPEASKSYWIKMHLAWTHNTAGLITEPGLTWPTGLDDWGLLMESATAAGTTAVFPAASWGQNDGAGTDPIAVQLSGTGNAGAAFFVRAEGLLIAGAGVAGNLEVTINRHTAGGGATTHTLLAGSWIAWQEIP